MALIEDIKARRISAMKSGVERDKRMLSILLGEVDRQRGSGKDIGDDTVIAAVRKMVNDAQKTEVLLGPGHPDLAELHLEMGVISVYLPKGLSAEDVASAVAAAKAAYPGDTTAVMRHLKTIPGMDMRLASQLVKS